MEKIIETKVGGWLLTITLNNDIYTLTDFCLYEDRNVIVRKFDSLNVVLDAYNDSLQRRLLEY